MSAAEWDRTPWWEQRLLREGLMAERPWIQRAALLQRVDDPLALRVGVFADELDEFAPAASDVDRLTSYGVRVRQSSVITPIYQSAGG